MARNVPSYLQRAAAEGGDTAAELTLCLIEATEEQTDAIKELTNTIREVGAQNNSMLELTSRPRPYPGREEE